MRSAARSTTTRFDLAKGWLMTPEQAGGIRAAALRHGLTTDSLVERVLGRLGDRVDTHYLYQKLSWQLGWLTAGLPLDRAPYVRIHRLHGVDPLAGHLRRGQVDMAIGEFIVRMYAALGEGPPDDEDDEEYDASRPPARAA